MALALLEILEGDPELRERARRVLGVGEAPAGPAYVTRSEARRMGVETRALLAAERSGELEAFRPGRSTVYRVADVRKLVEAHPVAPPTTPSPAPAGEPTDLFERARQSATTSTSARSPSMPLRISTSAVAK
jgi:hypothetical protein